MIANKDIAAFVDRMAKRLNESPKGSQRGRHRAAFIAVRPFIEGALECGHTVKATWEALREEGKISMTYEAFRLFCRAMRLGRGASAVADDLQIHQPKPAGSALGPSALTAPTRGGAPPVSPLPASSPAASDSRSFRHERVARTGKIYG